MLKTTLVGLFLSLCSFQLVAQDAIADTIILLNEISINTFRFEQFAEGSKQQSIDSAAKESYGSGTVAEVLSGFTTLYLKSYGISGNTSVSLRGTTSSQTAILWNGINLQDPLNGATNLELMPLNVVDEINVQFGGSGALYGSGAIGGAILLQSKAKLNTGIKGSASIGIGSFGLRFVNGSFHFGKEKIASALRIFYREAENNFPFVNTQQFGHPEIKQTNAAFQALGLSQDNTLKISKHQLLSTHFWLQKTQRELPPNMTILQSSQMQNDESIRFSADHSYNTSKWIWMSKMAFLSAKLNYNDSTNGIYAEHRSQSAILESEFAYRLNTNHLLNIGAHNRTDWGFSENFGETNHRNSFAILLSYKYANSAKTLNLAASIRQEIIDSKMVIPTPSLGWNYNLNPQIRIDGKFSRNYRQPTFNDLFWQDGFAIGNPDLVAETSWSEDLSFSFTSKDNQLKTSVSVFNSYIKNLILWLPVDGKWTPMNQKEVWSRGIEGDLSYTLKVKNLLFRFESHYSFNPSTIERNAENESSELIHKQLIYTPIHQIKAQISIIHRFANIRFEQSYIGKRYTMVDNSNWLESYPLSNLVLSSSTLNKRSKIAITIRINNIWNQSYQSMENYALPGRNYQLSMNYKIN